MKRKQKKGFTLIELLVSVFIFSLIIGGIVNALLTSVSIQQRIMADQKMFSEISFVLEYMGRTLRMAQKDIEGECIGTRNHNYNLLNGGNTIRFLNYDGECQEFSLIGGSINERISETSDSAGLPGFLPLTSDNVVVTSMVFDNAGSEWYSPSTNQSKVAVVLVVEPRTGDSEMRFQTVISQRKLNFPY